MPISTRASGYYWVKLFDNGNSFALWTPGSWTGLNWEFPQYDGYSDTGDRSLYFPIIDFGSPIPTPTNPPIKPTDQQLSSDPNTLWWITPVDNSGVWMVVFCLNGNFSTRAKTYDPSQYLVDPTPLEVPTD